MRSLTTRLFRRFASTEGAEKTPLYDYHVNKLKAKMTNFHGKPNTINYSNSYLGHVMPLLYPEGLVKEHNNCRENASFFDVSHMAQLK